MGVREISSFYRYLSTRPSSVAILALQHWSKKPLKLLKMHKKIHTTKTANLATWQVPDRQIGDFWLGSYQIDK